MRVQLPFIRHSSHVPMSSHELPIPSSESRAPSLPRWLKRNVPKGDAGHFTSQLIERLGLETVCNHAKCPNRMECYSRKTATFLLLGGVCTRACRFCSVPKGKPPPPDPDEPRRVAEAVRTLGLRHVVLTCVTRDDLADGGAEHFVRIIEAIRQASGDASAAMPEQRGGTSLSAAKGVGRQPATPFVPQGVPPTIEVLPSDFAGNTDAVDRLADAAPAVYNHNTETVPRLFSTVRDRRTNYAWTLKMFRRILDRRPAIALKTGLMLGLGETVGELLDTLAELHDAGCRMLTLGQYLQPSTAQTAVVRYVPPEEFADLGRLAGQMGFTQVAAGPLVRSSYHAREMLL
jgi:lipoyl synthase